MKKGIGLQSKAKWGAMDINTEKATTNTVYCENLAAPDGDHFKKICAYCFHLRKARRRVFCQMSGALRLATDQSCEFYKFERRS